MDRRLRWQSVAAGSVRGGRFLTRAIVVKPAGADDGGLILTPKLEAPDTPRSHAPRRRRSAVAILCLSVALGSSRAGADLQIVTQRGGPPALPGPVFEETGLPNFTMPMGTSSLLPPTGGSGSGSGGG